jgi:TRAP-type uncharacterized transport system substrate-binding protein
MFKQLNAACAASGDLQMVEVNTSGSTANVDMLIGNEVNGALVQSDVLFFRSRTEDLGNIKTLVSLHSEEVHVLALSGSRKEGGVAGIGAKQVTFSSLRDLAGRKIGAAGGSFVTAQVIRLQGEVPFTAVEFPSNDVALKALQAGTVDALIIVSGAPVPLIRGLNEGFKLLSIPEDVQAKLKAVYRPARLNYTNLRAAGVTTVSVDSLFVAREYKTPRMVNSLSSFRRCFYKNLDDLKETLGNHAKWQDVKADNQGKWVFMALPK